MDESNSSNVFLLNKMRSAKPASAFDKTQGMLQSLVEECLFVLASNLEDCLRESSTTLFQFAKNASNQSSQDGYFSAIQALDNHQNDIKEAFCQEVLAHFTRLTLNELSIKTSKEHSLDSLAVINNQEMDLIVAKETRAKRCQNAFRTSLEALALRFDFLISCEVTLLNLPISPTVLCDVLIKTLSVRKIDSQAQLIILKIFEETFLNKLGNLYVLCNHALIKQGVLPNLSHVRSSQTVGSSAVEPRTHTNSEPTLNIDTKREFTADTSTSTNAHVVSSAHSTSTARSVQDASLFFEQLKRASAQHEDYGEDLSDIARAITNSLNINPQSEKRALNAVRLSQQLFSKLGELVNNSPLDYRTTQQLALPVAQLACQDRMFLNNKTHDAKQLLNKLFDAALKIEPSNSDAECRDPLLKKCQDLINQIQSAKTLDQDFFKQLLIEFNQFLAHDEKRSKIIERRTIGAEQGKVVSEETEQFVEQTLIEITGGIKLEPAITQFINLGWKPVLIYNGLKSGVHTKAWEEKLQILLDVISSIQPFSSVEEMDKAKVEYPKLIQCIRENFNEIAIDHFKQDKLICGIDQCFTQNLGCEALSNSKPLKKRNIQELFNEVDALLQESINAEKRKVSEIFVDQARNFGRGSWFEIQESGNVVRGRLAAILGKQEKYIFVNRNGKKIKDLTLSSLAMALQEQKIKPLDSNQMFDLALSAVIQSSKLRTKRQGAV